MAKHSVKAKLRDVLTGEEFDTFGLSENDAPTLGYVLIDAGVRPDVYIRVPVVGVEDQQPEPVLAARFVDPPTSIEVGVATPFVPELYTDQAGTAEGFEGNETSWTFQAESGSFGGVNANELTVPAAGLVTVTATHTSGYETPPHTITAFVNEEEPPETSVFEADFSVEPNGTTLDQVTTASGHTFVLKPNGATGEVQGGQLIATSGFVHARMVGDAPPAEYDHHFVVDVKSFETTRMQAGVLARFNEDFTAGYFFFYSARNDERAFSIDSPVGKLAEAPVDLSIGQHQCRARIRNTFKALDLMVGGEWTEILRSNDNQFVGGMPGVYVSGSNTPSIGVGLISAEGLAPSADPEVDTSVSVGGVPANAVEETDYQIHAQLRELDGTVVSDSLDEPGAWTHAVTVGAGQATIGGPNDDILQVGPLV